jgi:methionine-gamma-lyase
MTRPHTSKTLHPETLALATGYNPESALRAAKPPVFMTATFTYPNAQHAKNVHRAYFDGNGPLADTPDHIYARLGHPGLDILEQRMAALDGAEDAIVYNSGMAAHTAAALAFLKPGDALIFGRPLYGGVDTLYNQVMAGYGVHAAQYTDGCDETDIWAACEAAMRKGRLALLCAESPGNPTAALVDIEMLVALAKRVEAQQGHKPLVLVDNTLLGPFDQRPLEWGADLCLTSLTKYCAGHSDAMGGCISGRKELIEPLRLGRLVWGSHLDPFNAWLITRSLETAFLRTARANTSAKQVASWLRAHKAVAGVTWLGFTPEGTKAHEVLQRQCKAAGSTFSFHLHGGEAEAFAFLDRLRLIKQAVNLGGTETLVCHSASTTHYAVAREQRQQGGITDGTIRISIGLEHPEDLIADLEQALQEAKLA